MSPVSRFFFLALALPWALTSAHAGPGAHGPNGEHLDAPSSAIAGVGALPRTEAATEAFELVATLHPDELSVLIDRFATNEPVLKARLWVESGGIKAEARFHADHGDYAVDDPKLLDVLKKPGEHALVFTLLAGDENELLDALLRVESHAENAGHGTSWAKRAMRPMPAAPCCCLLAVWSSGAVAL